MKRRILFVDDEPLALQGLQRMLRSMRAEWEMSFVESGLQGLEALSQQPFDVVVSDMLMPGMNGAQFLSEVRQRFPRAARLVLSGHAQRELVMRSVGPAHQYLAKPCPPEVLKATVTRALALSSALQSETVQEVVSGMDCVPSIPSLCQALTEQLQKADHSPEELTGIIARDPGMTAKILKMVNSPFFGFFGQVSNVAEAVSLLGLETMKSLVLSVGVFSQFELTAFRQHSLDKLWRHSLDTALGAKRIALAEHAGKRIVDEAFTGGLLHDVGKFILVSHFGGQYNQVVELAKNRQRDPRAAEKEAFGASHEAVGAYLVGLWGLPAPVLDTVSFHHDPSRSSLKDFTPLTAVHVANALVHEHRGDEHGVPAAQIDLKHLAELGFAERLDSWREMVQQTLCTSS